MADEKDAPQRLPLGHLALLAGGLFVVATNNFVVAGVLPDVASTLGATQTAVAYSVTWYAVVVAVASPVVSIACARRSRKGLMAVGLVLVAVGTAIGALAGSLPLFVVGRVVAAAGGATFVPTATAVAPAITAPAQRGRAIGAITLGFTVATAVGAPGGTALSGIGGWRLPLLVIAGLALALAVAVPLALGSVPVDAPASLRERLGVLRGPRIIVALVALALLTCGSNVVYLFASTVTSSATGGASGVLALLLLAFGAGAVGGTAIAGRFTDRLGSGRVGAVAIAVNVVALAVLPGVLGALPLLFLVFVVWGAGAFSAPVPVQDRLVELDPPSAPITLGWYSSALYLGIALAPVLGGAVLPAGRAVLILTAAATCLAAGGLFLTGYLKGGARSTAGAAGSGG